MYQVVHVTTAHSATDARIFHKEVRTAAELGFRVAVVGPHPVREAVHGIDIYPIFKPKNRTLRRVLSPLLAGFQVVRLRAKIVHFHDPEFIPVAFLLKLLAGKKIVWDVHEYYSEIQSLRAPPGVVRETVRRVVHLVTEDWPLRYFDRSVFPTEALRKELALNDRAVSLVNLLPQYLLSKGHAKPDSKRYDLVFMGSLSPFRAEPMLRMMEEILSFRPNTKVLLIGVPEATRTWFERNFQSDAVRSSFFFQARVPHEQVFRLLCSARIGFNYHPLEKRFQVALPMKVYEYMACGLPVVCTRFPELEEQFEEGKEIVFPDSNDPIGFCRAILNLLDDDEYAVSVGLAGLKALGERINWDLSEKPKMKDLYEGLL